MFAFVCHRFTCHVYCFFARCIGCFLFLFPSCLPFGGPHFDPHSLLRWRCRQHRCFHWLLLFCIDSGEGCESIFCGQVFLLRFLHNFQHFDVQSFYVLMLFWYIYFRFSFVYIFVMCSLFICCFPKRFFLTAEIRFGFFLDFSFLLPCDNTSFSRTKQR